MLLSTTEKLGSQINYEPKVIIKTKNLPVLIGTDGTVLWETQHQKISHLLPAVTTAHAGQCSYLTHRMSVHNCGHVYTTQKQWKGNMHT